MSLQLVVTSVLCCTTVEKMLPGGGCRAFSGEVSSISSHQRSVLHDGLPRSREAAPRSGLKDALL